MLSTIGYEAATLGDFIETLKLADVDILVDIRERAQSRRKGFSKTALASALAKEGIDYVHFRELGDPKDGREAARAGNWKKFRQIYAGVMASQEAKQALDDIEKLLFQSSACLLCYERDPKTCHRSIVAKELSDRLKLQTKHLGVQKIGAAA
ncbi:DUF488 family protein [Hyphobacterium sp.]|uniref:DUF488 domain-containing protein n=1 Tax=Hyphobacterium sp. TaxID=2004662 RepID=UPI003BAC60CE